MLPIPSLRRVAPEVQVSYGGTRTAGLALNLLDAGILAEKPLTRGTRPAQLFQGALAQWQRAHLGELRVLPGIALYVVEGDPRHTELPGGLWVHAEVNEPRDGIPHLALARRCSALQRQVPGLGTRAIACLDVAQQLTAQVATPPRALAMAEWFYWQGESDETGILEEYHANGGGIDDIPLTATQFFAAIPEWASREAWKRPKALRPRTRLAGIAREVHEACEAVLALSVDARIKALCTWDRRREDGSEWLSFAAIARWSEGDPMPQILDDWYQDAVNGETWDTCASYQLDDAASFPRWLELWPAWLRMYAAMDRLLSLIGTPL